MKTSTTGKFLKKGIYAIFTLALIATVVMGQNLNVSGGTFIGSGTYNIKGNINTTGTSGSGNITIPGKVNLNGTSTLQQLGVSTSHALIFDTLLASGAIAKQADANITVDDSLNVNITGGFCLIFKPIP